MSIKILRPGSLSHLQDLGRKGFLQSGFAQAGAADQFSHRWANKLLDNPANAATIEIALGGFVSEVLSDTVLSLTGADMAWTLNGKQLETWCSHRIKSGDTLACKYARDGVYAYIGVKHGFNLPADKKMFLKSVASAPKETTIFSGTKYPSQLRESDTLYYQAIDLVRSPALRCVSTSERPDYDAALVLRIKPTYQFKDFSQNQIDKFFSNTYSVDPASDRMGVRLSSEKSINWEKENILSEGIAFGAVQITSQGQPIVLLRDRQTLGGYPKIGTVLQEDCNKLAQRRPWQTVRFKLAP